MNMEYHVGQFVGYVPVAVDVAVPAAPARWHVLAVSPGRDAKVMKAFYERCISGWSPQVVRVVSRGTGQAARRPHLGRRIAKPFLPGLILLPEFELDRLAEIRSIPDVDNVLEFGKLRSWLNVTEMQLLRDIVAVENLPPSQRKRALLELKVRYGFMIAADAAAESGEARLRVNQSVSILDGVFAGFRALIERIDSNGRLSVFVGDGKRGVKVSGLTETQIELI